VTFTFDPTTGEWIAYAVAAVTSLTTGWLALRKRLAAANVDAAKGAAEVDILSVLRAEIGNLREQNSTLTTERNGAMKELGALGAQVAMFSTLLTDIRTEQKLVAVDAKSIASALVVNTDLTKQAVERADAAYKEANTVNSKIAGIGLQMKDGSKLAENEIPPDATPAPVPA
jgi:hypothetical protein